MKWHSLFCAFLVTVGTSLAFADCSALEPVARNYYESAKTAYNAKDMTTAKEHAAKFWKVHDIEKCSYSEGLGARLTSAGLGKFETVIATPTVVIRRESVKPSMTTVTNVPNSAQGTF